MTKMAIRPGDTFDGRYLLNREITRGSRSLLFEAEHLLSGRLVAVKVQKPGVARTPVEHAAFAAQARILADCAHPNVVELLDGGTIDIALDETVNVPYLVMELLEGRTLEGVIGARGSLGIDDTVRLGVALCRALAKVHRAGVVHGAVRPDHIVLPPRLQDELCWEEDPPLVKLIDFGRPARDKAGVRIPPGQSREGLVYESPEQLSDEPISPASDVYSLGAVLYECLTGNPPVGRIIVPPNQLNKRVPKLVSQAIEAAVQHDANERPQGAQAFALALSKTAPPPPPRKPPKPKQDQKPRAARVAYVAPVEIRRDVGQPIDARCEDISVGGMMVVSGAKLADQEQVVVHFALPSGGEQVIAPARVCWRKAARNAVFTGLQIEKLSTKAQDAIEQHVKRLRDG
jgi:serine/threonine protein kinase